jgi:hypothetical protein
MVERHSEIYKSFPRQGELIRRRWYVLQLQTFSAEE